MKNPLPPRLFRSTVLFLLIASIFTQASCIPFLQGLKAGRNARISPPLPANQSRQKDLAREFDGRSPADVIQKEVYDLLAAKDFKAIDIMANDARVKKQRLAGGYWKLDNIYEGITSFYAEYKGQTVSDEMWKNRIELLKQWKENAPGSITARVALGEAYIDYGWFARGTGFTNTVSRDDQALLAERLDLAEKELFEAKPLNVKCPRWYREMLFLGMANGWPLDQFEQAYDEAITFEPNYLQAYLVKSENLTPKWHGENGDWLKFVDSLPSKLATLKTDEADIIYFVVVVNKLDDRSMDIDWARIAKERIQKGFADLEKRYGADNLRLNQYAYISCMKMDFQAAKAAFDRIGKDYNKEVWSEKTFNSMKQFADKGLSINKS